MVNAVGSAAFSAYTGSGASAAGLQAQLARYQKALSECVSCDSAKTREGRQAIQEAASKISEVKARIEEAATVKSNAQPVAASVKTPADIAARQDAKAPASGLLDATVGSRLDVFA